MSAATPLTRYGSRVPATPARTATPTGKVTATATVTPTGPVTVPPTIRTMTVCVPEELPTQVLAASRQLDRHLAVTGTSTPRLWAKPTVGPLARRHLIAARRGRPTYCAGGPVRLLDLAGMRYGATVGASLRHQHWTRVVHGTRPATPWPQFAARHHADPTRYPIQTATADFDRQPRVLAMRMYNAAAGYGAAQLDPMELEMLQAGPAAYANYHALRAVCTDAVLTADGTRLAPASAQFTDWVTYLALAIHYLDGLDGSQRLLAVTL